MIACGTPAGSTGNGSSEEASDSDGDGLTDTEEADLGTDPQSSDSDGDGLADKDETDLGTDPLAIDSDGDSYSDADEIATEHDPLDGDDKIYQGGWPYNPNKDAIEDPGFGKRGKVGGIVPDLITYDLNGDTFDLYDYAGHGKPVMVDVSAEWCYYCQQLGLYMAGKSSYFDDYETDYPELPTVRDMIANGDLYWVEIIDQNQSYETVAQEDLKQWERKYPIPNSPVIADEEQNFIAWTKGAGYPTLFLADENMVVLSLDARDYFTSLAAAAELAP
jgi:thiol-disulfide isomerase/thioredoxin